MLPSEMPVVTYVEPAWRARSCYARCGGYGVRNYCLPSSKPARDTNLKSRACVFSLRFVIVNLQLVDFGILAREVLDVICRTRRTSGGLADEFPGPV